MAVNLSPLGGVAAQFFNNDGVPLAGGLIYTYLAGSTTPAATYTTGSGSIPHSNPIVLDSAGRVPSGEIWLTDTLSYKFVIKDSTGALIGTYDNLVGINSNFVNYTSSQEIQTATAGQTVFTLTTMAYQPGTNSLTVFVDGVNQYGPGASYAFTETSSTTVTFASGLHVGASVKFTTTAINSGSYGNAFQISYTPPFTASVATNVGAKLSQYVSVKDFGATGNGTTDDTTFIQNALNSGQKGIYFPKGEYRITATLNVPRGVSLFGDGYEQVILNGYALANTDAIFYLTGGDQFSTIDNLQFKGQASGSESIGIKVTNGYSVSYTNLRFLNLSYGLLLDEAGACLVQNCTFSNCLYGAKCTGGSGYTFAFNNFNYGTDTGIQVDVSPTTTFPTGIIVSQCLFTSNIGIRVPLAPGAYGGHNFVADQCYFEGDLGVGTVCQPFRIGNEGSGNPISCATITNGRMAMSSSLPSVYTNIDTLFFAGNIIGQNVTFPTSVLQLTLSNNIFVGTLTNGATKSININDLSNFLFQTDRLTPINDGVDVLGDNTHRWKNVYSKDGMVLGTNVVITTGANTPEGAVTAVVGSLYLRNNGGANTTLYVKESGTGNTGWVAK